MITSKTFAQMRKLYEIAKDGSVYSKRRDIYLKPRLNTHGYYVVTLYYSINGEKTFSTEPIHRLVMAKFGNLLMAKKKNTVNHKNGVKTDNRLKNLELLSASENLEHWRHGGKDHHSLSFKRNLLIFKSKLPFIMIAQKYNVSLKHIVRVKSRSETYEKHLWRDFRESS